MDQGVIKFFLFLFSMLLVGFMITSSIPGVSAFGVDRGDVINLEEAGCTSTNQSSIEPLNCAYNSVASIGSFVGASSSIEIINSLLLALTIVAILIGVKLFLMPLVGL